MNDGDGATLSRGEVLLKGALAVGAAYGLGMVGPYVRRAVALVGENDLDTLNFLLAFEYLQQDLYGRPTAELKPSAEFKQLIALLEAEEDKHVETVAAQIRELGGKPDPKGKYGFSFYTAEGFLELAGILEKTVIGAYNGVIPMIESREVRETAGSIVQIEGRHSAAIRIQRGEEPAPEAFDEALTPLRALDGALKFGGSAIYQVAG